MCIYTDYIKIYTVYRGIVRVKTGYKVVNKGKCYGYVSVGDIYLSLFDTLMGRSLVRGGSISMWGRFYKVAHTSGSACTK